MSVVMVMLKAGEICHRCLKTTIKLTLIRWFFFLLLLTHTPVSSDLSAAQCHPCYKLPEHFHHTKPYLRLGSYDLSLWISWLPQTAHSIDLQFVKALPVFWSLGQKHWKAEDCQRLHKNPKNQLQDKLLEQSQGYKCVNQSFQYTRWNHQQLRQETIYSCCDPERKEKSSNKS